MQLIVTVLPFIQIILALLLATGILLQQSASGLGGTFGGDNFSAGFHTRRGMEKTLFRATIVIAVLFVLSAFIALIT
jgi:protein translocase SecG subunit